MDHSTESYIKRLSTEKLEQALMEYLRPSNGERPDAKTVLLILREFEERERQNPEPIAPEIQAVWDEFERETMEAYPELKNDFHNRNKGDYPSPAGG